MSGTNILLDQERDSDTVWLDHNEKDPTRRYKMFTTATDAYDFGPDLADVLAEFMAAGGPANPQVEGRIVRAE